jgi:nucleotide-binding universal stress UspA family protein
MGPSEEDAVDRIVIGVDRSHASLVALRWAAGEARSSGAELVVVHAYLAPIAYVGTDREIARIDPDLHETAAGHLATCIETSGADLEGLRVTRELHPGRAADGLLELASSAELLVVGVRGAGGFEGTLLGSTAEHCARHAPCPLVVVPELVPPTSGRVVVGVDGSPASRRALSWSVDEARRRGARVEVVGVFHPYDARGPFGGDFMQLASPGSTERFRHEAEQRVGAVLADVAADGVDIRSEIVPGHPARSLIEAAAEADLLVVGRRGHAAFRGYHLGSVTRRILHHAPTAIAVIPT